MNIKELENKAKEIRKGIIEQVYLARFRSSRRFTFDSRFDGCFIF